MAAEPYAWWSSLRHGGLLIAPARLAERFPAQPPPLSSWLAERLRRDLVRAADGSKEDRRAMAGRVLELVCGLESRDDWLRGGDLGSSWTRRDLTGAAVKPWGVWRPGSAAAFPVFWSDDDKLGLGRGRRGFAQVVEWLRRSNRHLALLTNGRQWRLVYAGLDHHAWAEWDVALWLEHGLAGPQVDALRALLSPSTLREAPDGGPSLLLGAVLDSRRGQAELTQALGERVRRAVELLIVSCGPALEGLDDVAPTDIYLAANRAVMRLVVVLFAEARDLLPRDNLLYHAGYGLGGLREQLNMAGGGAAAERLRHRRGVWPRILGLWRLVYEGSHHPELPVPRYGGGLFEPGDGDAADPVRRALAVFEDPGAGPDDLAARTMLDLISRCPVRLRQGRGSATVDAPVDFADLSTEYIGILYEGLLDFELRRAEAADPVVFLALGDEPALPLSRLEAMPDGALPEIMKKFAAKAAPALAGDDAEDGEEEDGAEGTDAAELAEGMDALADVAAVGDAAAGEDDGGVAESAVEDPPVTDDDRRHAARRRALAWARRAAAAGKLVRKPRVKSAAAQAAYDAALGKAAEGLIARLVLPGEWFLVRWGGTRKGAGTFYTPPGLAVPTAQRTLRPMAYVAPPGADGEPDELAPAEAWTVRRPEEILALKVCDPAMGSGSFLVAGLRYLTDALFESLHAHERLQPLADGTRLTLPMGAPETGSLGDVFLPAPPDSPDLEPLLRARLKRYVVERCLYGVDIDPLAVELARLALWVETMDRTLPFGFLDHKLKVGNSLVGCWFDRFRDYPALAWEREGGDKGHKGVHHGEGLWTKAIKDFRNTRVKKELPAWITGQRHFLDSLDGRPPEAVHDTLRSALEALHLQADPAEPDRLAAGYRELQQGEGYRALKAAFDTWCACWFWPADALDRAPSPSGFEQPAADTAALVAELARRHGFFHWELEYPDVFRAEGGGFDVVLGNPPWENKQPNIDEFFSNVDPLFRTYGRVVKERWMVERFQVDESLEDAWVSYNAAFRAFANWVKNVADPYDLGVGDTPRPLGLPQAVGRHWLAKLGQRRGFADPEHPFRLQQGRIFTYRLFLESSLKLLRTEGRLGLIVPSGVYSDSWSKPLRQYLLDRCRWRWLFGFENRDGIFDIDGRFKFCMIIAEKDRQTDIIHTAFMRRNLTDWEDAERMSFPYGRDQVVQFSPGSLCVLEIQSERDKVLLAKIYDETVLLGDQGPDGWGISYSLEFMMNTDAHLFPPRPQWEAKGYRPDAYGRWVGPGGDVALPLYEGRMIGQFDFSDKGWVSGKGRTAVWREIPWDAKVVEPQYLMGAETLRKVGAAQSVLGACRIAFMDITSATNARSMICCPLIDGPCGNSVPLFRTRSNLRRDHQIVLGAILNSFVFDHHLRARVGGLHLNWFVVEETALPPPAAIPEGLPSSVASLVMSLVAGHPSFSHHWLQRVWDHSIPWRRLWAITLHERLRLRCMLDAIVAELYGLDWDDFAYILRDCDHPAAQMRQNAFARRLDPKGFWRVDKEKDPELRHTVLSLVALRDLKDAIAKAGGGREDGIEAFCRQNDGDGWMLPETLRLADFGLGHDERAQEAQPVRERMGERFLPWQLEQSAEESWAECEEHARNLLGAVGFARLQRELWGEAGAAYGDHDAAEPLRKVAEERAGYDAGGQKGLWDA